MHRRAFLFLSAPAALSLSGCGFALRKAPTFAFTTLYSGLAESSPLGVELRRSLQATRKVEVITEARRINEAQVVLDVVGDQREKVILSRNAAGQVREFQLRLRFRFKLRTLAGKELIPETEILQQRDISFNESAVLAKEAEENLLYRDMQSDVVQQIMRRLAAVTEL
ncbi:LPS assembly lipoprotein LptE [Polaromonas sp.]|uniref:LPS-assembly lipoprotein LptE n=1 Tax=Polaromonas sp. TaxID=1869339 RepID=UPI003265630F